MIKQLFQEMSNFGDSLPYTVEIVWNFTTFLQQECNAKIQS